MTRLPQTTPPDIDDLLVVGPFHEALRAAIRRSGLTLERLRGRMVQRGVPVALSTLSDWQKGHRRPGSFEVVEALEEVLRLPPSSLRDLLGHTADGLDEREGPISELLDSLPGSRDRDVLVITQQQKAFVDNRGAIPRVWNRTLMCARRDGVDRFVLRFYGNPTCAIDDVHIKALENCRVGRVERHPQQPVLVAELLLDTSLRTGETWVFEFEIHDPSPEPAVDFGHGFTHPASQYVLEVRFDPRRLPASCHSYARPTLTDSLHRTGALLPNGHHAVHLAVSNVRTGVVGIIWDWPEPHPNDRHL